MAGLQSLRLFVAAYEEGSFTAAGARENATQSGVSQHIRRLEEECGAALFIRGGGPLRPTPAADAYYRRCVDLLRRHREATTEAMGFAGAQAGELSVGLMPTMTRSVLAPALTTFLRLNPNVAVRVVEAYSNVLVQKVRSAELDFAIVPAFEGLPGLRSLRFLSTPEILVSGAQSPLTHMAPVRLADLPALKVVLPSLANRRSRTLKTYFQTNGVEIARSLELDAMMGTLDLVVRSDWVAVLPGLMVASDIAGGSLRINPIVDPPLFLDLVSIEPSRRPLSSVAEAFHRILLEVAEELNAGWSAVAFNDPPRKAPSGRRAPRSRTP